MMLAAIGTNSSYWDVKQIYEGEEMDIEELDVATALGVARIVGGEAGAKIAESAWKVKSMALEDKAKDDKQLEKLRELASVRLPSEIKHRLKQGELRPGET